MQAATAEATGAVAAVRPIRAASPDQCRAGAGGHAGANATSDPASQTPAPRAAQWRRQAVAGQDASANANNSSGQRQRQFAARRTAATDQSTVRSRMPRRAPQVHRRQQAPLQRRSTQAPRPPCRPSARPHRRPSRRRPVMRRRITPACAGRAAAATPNLNSLAVEIAAKSQSGAKQFRHPPGPAGTGPGRSAAFHRRHRQGQAHLSADQPQTLELLQKDAPTLTRALRDAGLDVSQSGLNFSLRQQSSGHDGAGQAPELWQWPYVHAFRHQQHRRRFSQHRLQRGRPTAVSTSQFKDTRP